MNERIRELADRAEHYAKQQAGSDWEVEVPYSQKVFRQKFAELIVRECVKVVMRSVSDDEPKEAWYLIKEHFGVQE